MSEAFEHVRQMKIQSTLDTLREHVPGPICVAVKNLLSRASECGVEVGLVVLLAPQKNDELLVELLWPPVADQNVEVKDAIKDSVRRG